MTKTINEVLDSIKSTAIEYLNGGNESHNAYELLMSFHSDIEAAVKALEADRDNWRRQALSEDARANAATCQDSLQVGNVARLREALKYVLKMLYVDCKGEVHICAGDAEEIIAKLNSALSAPARNCDRFSNNEEAWDAYCDYMSDSNVMFLDYEDWLFAEAKGE